MAGGHQEDMDLASIMAAADVDGDGTLNYEEFIAATANLNKLEREANILAAFNQFDTDHSGALTKDEIREALASAGSTDDEIQVEVHSYSPHPLPQAKHRNDANTW